MFDFSKKYPDHGKIFTLDSSADVVWGNFLYWDFQSCSMILDCKVGR